MNITLINCSPKGTRKPSASGFLLSSLRPLLEDGSATVTEFTLSRAALPMQTALSILNNDCLVFFFPLYFDALPAHFIEALQTLEQAALELPHRAKAVYAVANCGAYEGRQTIWALRLIENWCTRAGLTYGQGVGVGGGALLSSGGSPIDKGRLKPLLLAFTALSANILSGARGEDLFLHPDTPRLLYRWSAQANITMEAAKFKLPGYKLGRRL